MQTLQRRTTFTPRLSIDPTDPQAGLPTGLPRPTYSNGEWVRAAAGGQSPAGAFPGVPGAVDIAGVRTANRPAPAAGLNEPKKTSPMNSMLQNFMYQMMGMKPPKPKAKPAVPAAGLDNSGPARAERASNLFAIGAGLMD